MARLGRVGRPGRLGRLGQQALPQGADAGLCARSGGHFTEDISYVLADCERADSQHVR